MTTDAAAATAFDTPAQPALPASDRNRILIYLGVLVFIISFGGGGLVAAPLFFILKNRLHLGATQLSLFLLLAALPGYLAFVPGFVRDLWNPFGLRDRGYMIVFGGLAAVLYIVFAFVPVSVVSLLLYSILLGSILQFAVAGQTGLGATIARQHVMSGQMSTVMNVVASVAGLLPLAVGGYLSNYLEHQAVNDAARQLFLVAAAIMGGFALFAIWRPKVVYDNVRAESGGEFHPLKDLIRLLRHYPVYPALGIWILWNFAPGSGTPLQFHLQNTLHASDAQATMWNVLFSAGFIPTFLLFGWLCRKFPLRVLLFWGTVFAVPQMVPLLFVKTVPAALLGAVASGLMGGVATAAYLDLMIRSCPRGLEGTMLMASNALYVAITRAGDVLGGRLYETFHTFTVCAIAITVVYALIIPTLWLVPRR
ncbi:MAG TPA: MFS transporter, partial [Caulobacteraceae bacterium]|nr:MFS transporter [Caulobacteraceae bacterium]